ncbi:hypothetical protein GUJ93_ZPchr0005g14648 [Zizania palustris]|uniref:Uncharacterized protein n=1 Tax=Zizania palustris TaxID=103762 RepID=A0A8J5SGY4_ZIZPA|nr:hypothetical protein GUJ93_ZPchr0005g14648 [Zizania palustris]
MYVVPKSEQNTGSSTTSSGVCEVCQCGKVKVEGRPCDCAPTSKRNHVVLQLDSDSDDDMPHQGKGQTVEASRAKGQTVEASHAKGKTVDRSGGKGKTADGIGGKGKTVEASGSKMTVEARTSDTSVILHCYISVHS